MVTYINFQIRKVIKDKRQFKCEIHIFSYTDSKGRKEKQNTSQAESCFESNKTNSAVNVL